MSGNYDRTAIGNRLRSGIVDMGMSMEEFAKRYGLSEGTVKSWCCGRSGMSLESAVMLCDIFGWPLDYLAVRVKGVPTAANVRIEANHE